MWETCGSLNLPVAIHVSDPIAFFRPTDHLNERYEELSNHPDWSFASPEYPSNAEILEARNRVFARHPKTQFVALHVGNFAEDLENVSANLDRFPNMHVDIAARLNELGRQPRAARRFFDRYQDRIVFGTDATPHGDQFHSKRLATRSTRSISGFWRPPMNTSTMHPPQHLRRVGGVSQVSNCRQHSPQGL